jgi:uncharacterized cupredoxin-like copper-binding protein
MKTSRRLRVLFQVLVLLALLLGLLMTGFFSTEQLLPWWLRLLLSSLPFAVLPFAIGWIHPAWWWSGIAGVVLPIISAVITIFKPNWLLPGVPWMLPLTLLALISALSFAYLGRRMGQRRLQNMPGTSLAEGDLTRWAFLSTLLLIALSCMVLWAIVFLKIPVHITLMDGQIQAKPAITKGWSGLKFYVENQGTQPHEFIMVYTDRPSDQLPVFKGVVHFSTPDITKIDDGLAHEVDEMWRPLPSPPLEPGEKRNINYGYSGLGNAIGKQTITIICNLPGHYEQGEFATVTITE